MALSDSDSSIRVYMREIVKTDLITPEKEIELAARIRDGDESAREHMIKANLRLVVKIARDYSNYGVPMADLISEGNIGLMKAVEKFDPEKGGKLSTYASWWIKQSIKRALANQSKTIRLPVHLVDKLAKVRRITALLTEELGREPTDDEMVEELGIPRRKFAMLKQASQRPASLDAPLGDEDSSSYAEIIGDENAVSPSDALENKNDHGELESLRLLLDERETEIIDSRFGLNGKKPMTLEEISRSFGVSRERIRQLQNIALGKMKRALNRKEASPRGKEAMG
ncbi:RNA polymerase sigma factor RpoD/SigA [Akkermansiaceae bacterium]|nr:RNA polymerase sigma factor RpoD/SigA [Akkermansiaceae bacterium]MDB4419211.1 RNA polymerase sigma factor RpoD/SigA [bacterium]MDB4500843.1 RNA polymerase sigma factor RpoD/SigA [Akkermansiaceae bacterium]MDB4541402.1 RNA polymerase sigma factor RpoD/SigA [Akkermansiaceae bacterium]